MGRVKSHLDGLLLRQLEEVVGWGIIQRGHLPDVRGDAGERVMGVDAMIDCDTKTKVK